MPPTSKTKALQQTTSAIYAGTVIDRQTKRKRMIQVAAQSNAEAAQFSQLRMRESEDLINTQKMLRM